LFDLINEELSFTDLTKNKFDLSQFLGVKENKILYRALSEKEIKDTDKSVEYKNNDMFFRSDNFTTNHDGLHILFSGCSESEGVGDNIENAWTNILYNKISKDIKCSGFFNLSRSGWGWSKIITNALIYFETYGYPDVYFILLPNNQRMHKFYRGDNGGSFWKHEQLYPKGYYLSREKNKKTEKFISDEKEYNEDFLKFLLGWKLFNKICKDNNINLIFSTWDELDSDNLDNLNMFENFLNMDSKNNCGPYINKWYETNEKTKYDLRKRDGHNGIIIHNFWADSFYSLWKDLQK
jgi:hypothetical protein